MIFISGYRLKNDLDSCLENKDDYISVNCCGYEKYMTKSVKTLRKTGRPDFQIIYIINGCGDFLVNGEMAKVHAGNSVIFHPGEIQQYAYEYQNSTEVYWVHFTGYGAYDIVKNVGLSNSSVNNIGIRSTCIEAFTTIIRELQLKAPLYEYSANAALLGLLTSMGRYSAEIKNPKPINESIKNVMEQMHTKYNYNWTISTLAKQCNLSPDWFMHKFKNQTGMSPMEYLAGIRLDKARWLLLNSSLSIKEISYIVGYENPLYFSKLFKKAEGISPDSFRNSKS